MLSLMGLNHGDKMRRKDRVLEQGLISAYTIKALDNAINSIAEMKWGKFEEERKRIGDLISGLVEEK